MEADISDRKLTRKIKDEFSREATMGCLQLEERVALKWKRVAGAHLKEMEKGYCRDGLGGV